MLPRSGWRPVQHRSTLRHPGISARPSATGWLADATMPLSGVRGHHPGWVIQVLAGTRRDRKPAVHAGYTRSRQTGGVQRAPAVTIGPQPTAGQTANAASTRQPFSRRARVRVSHLRRLGCCWPRSAGTAAWPNPATCWTAPPMASCWMTTAPPTRRKSRPRVPNCSPAGRTTPSRSAATSARAPGPAKPNKELWASSSPGRARYGATGTGGSLRVG
jgi:hypothetical protein